MTGKQQIALEIGQTPARNGPIEIAAVMPSTSHDLHGHLDGLNFTRRPIESHNNAADHRAVHSVQCRNQWRTQKNSPGEQMWVWSVRAQTVRVNSPSPLPPPRFSDIFPKRLGFLVQILHAYYTLFLSALDCLSDVRDVRAIVTCSTATWPRPPLV